MAGQVTVSQGEQEVVIAVNGRFDFYVHKEFRDAYERVLQKGRAPKFVIDLAGTEYLDSSALGMLLVLRERVGTETKIDIVHCRPEVKSILEIANFHSLFHLS
ncbi:MAG: STAS domain-containing protein [Nitrospirae bacterium]|nr:STAS domain-containing protein [Nitrospirota bacterium]